MNNAGKAIGDGYYEVVINITRAKDHSDAITIEGQAERAPEALTA